MGLKKKYGFLRGFVRRLWVFPIKKKYAFFIDFGLKLNFNVVLAKKKVLGTIQSYFIASPDGILLELLLKKVVRLL